MVLGGLVVVSGGFRVALGTQDLLNTNMLVSLVQKRSVCCLDQREKPTRKDSRCSGI